jgi:hypothetical protein
MRTLSTVLFALILAACSGGEGARLPPQSWNDVQVIVEVRPAPPRAGMNEFIVIATNPDRRAAHDLIVSLRSDPGHRWQQAIQDGNIGVYRRAVPVDSGLQTLYVNLRRGLKEGTLEFPLMVE